MEAASNSVVIPTSEEVNIEKEATKTPDAVLQDINQHTNGVDASIEPPNADEVTNTKLPDLPNDVDNSIVPKEEIITESKDTSADSSITLEVSETSEATEIHVEQPPGEHLQIETEIYIEKEEVVSIINYDNDNDDTNKILSQLDGHNVDLNDPLGPSNNFENNNGISKPQQVLNNEELLDILEGNDENSPKHINDDKFIEDAQSLETALALQQCQELKQRKRRLPVTRKKKSKKVDTSVEEQEKAGKNIINVLVQDWDDDENEGTKEENKEKSVKKKAMKGDIAEDNHKGKENAEINSIVEMAPDATDGPPDHTDTPSVDHHDESKSSDETPLKRASRVIKKKVIFDPDNPDTFTKSKNIGKVKESQSETAESVPKKKVEITSPSPSKSPTNKTLWKKPHARNKNHFKRLTEVDKLLMDEGAVNMIYQLTPEATKGKKNTRTKAELIKKINQSTPETKEMKFRERRRETQKNEEPESKKVLGHKDRLSVNSSVKSPSVYEDFEAHSADDSIIYRRHSSSSYSSTCMSPRRLSDVETAIIQSSKFNQRTTGNNEKSDASNMDTSDTFLSGEVIPDTAEIIDKKVCLNLKQKLNSKLSNALNMKRKRDSKVDKPAKLKKTMKAAAQNIEKVDGAKYDVLSVCIDNNLAEIIIDNAESPNSFYNIEVTYTYYLNIYLFK